jgi:hypothetical protein
VEYLSNSAPSVGSLSVTLSPNVGGWRRQGSTLWHPSGFVEPNLNVGSYLLEFQPVANYVTPENVEVMVQSGQTSTVSIVYLIPYATTGAGPALAQTPPPYPFVGQIQTDIGLGSGFVPLDRIVVTAAHVVFNDVTLSYVTGIRWFFQEQRGSFEAPPQIPTGFYVLDGYASQRAVDGAPDVSSPASQQLDVAVLYFMEPTARGGQSGYLASNSAANSWLTGSANKLILGYPSAGVDPSTVGELYATPTTTSALTNYSGSLFSTSAISTFAGNSGGPLCVQESNAYYPAAIYLGGTNETVVRAIDSQVIDLMNNAELSGNGGANHVGGGVIVVGAGLSGNTAFALGSLAVNIMPPDAVTSGAVWQLSGESFTRASGSAKPGLATGTYSVSFPKTITGYTTPAAVMPSVKAGGTTYVTAVYVPDAPPTITNLPTNHPTATADPARLFKYQITASLEPTSFGATGLPAGLSIDPSNGIISGIPTASGVSTVTLSATNSKGTGTATLTLTVPLPGQLTITTVGSGTVPKNLRGVTIQPVGSSIAILATAAKGYLFGNWTDLDSGQVVSQPLYTNPSMPLVLDLQATFVQNPFIGGTYAGLLQGGTFAQSGYMRLTLLPTGSFTAVFNLGQASTTLKSAFTLPSNLNNPIQYNGALSLPDGRSFTLTLSLNSGSITGTISSIAGGSPLNFTATSPVAAPVPAAVAALNGAYATAFTIPSPAAGLPTGSGAAAITVTKTGAIRFAGNLGDGLKASLGGVLDANAGYPFYLYAAGSKTAGAEIALGRISAVLGQKPAQFRGALDWIRNADADDPAYPAGFYTRLIVTADPPQSLSLLAPTAHLTFSGADLTAPLLQELSISPTGVATPTSLPNGLFSFKYSKATGLFTGSFLDFGSKPRTFSGAFLPSQTKGFGYFEETTGVTGSVLLQTGP